MNVSLTQTDGTQMTDSFPPFPDRIKDLGDLASDLWWSWHSRSRELFRRLDYALWRLAVLLAILMFSAATLGVLVYRLTAGRPG